MFIKQFLRQNSDNKLFSSLLSPLYTSELEIISELHSEGE